MPAFQLKWRRGYDIEKFINSGEKRALNHW